MLLPLIKNRTFFVPLLISLIATPLFLLGGIASAGAGHGNYHRAKILFPLTMLSTVVFASITIPFIVLAVLQFPLYGLLLGRANAKGAFFRWAAGILIIHLLSVFSCFLLVGPNFS